MLNEIKSMVERFRASADRVTRADIDELMMLIDTCENSLPDRFLSVAKNVDVNFQEDYNHLFGNDYDRLSRILSVADRVPTKEVDTIEGPLNPTFSLADSDRTRVLELCAQMRKIILSSNLFDHPHKIRLANRVAAMEVEVHKRKGRFDVILGGVSDVGETLGKFGVDIEPLTKRMKEIAQVTRRGTKEYDQIPAPDDVKRLPAPNEDETPT